MNASWWYIRQTQQIIKKCWDLELVSNKPLEINENEILVSWYLWRSVLTAVEAKRLERSFVKQLTAAGTCFILMFSTMRENHIPYLSSKNQKEQDRLAISKKFFWLHSFCIYGITSKTILFALRLHVFSLACRSIRQI